MYKLKLLGFVPHPNLRGLVDWTGRALRADKPRYIEAREPKILARLGIDEERFIGYSERLHAYYQHETAVFSIEPVELIAGAFPKRQRRLVEAWAELHQKELLEDWALLQAGKLPRSIAPLQ